MKAPCNDDYPLGINSSCTYDWVPCDHGSDHDVLLRFHFTNNMEHLSSTSQRSISDSIMLHLRELTLWYVDDNVVLHHLLLILAGAIDFCQSTGSGLSLTENTEYLLLAIPFLHVVAIRWHPLKPLDMMCRGPHHPWTFQSVY